MKKFLPFFLIIFLGCNNKRSDPDFESGLRRNAERANSDEARVTWLSRLAWYYIDIDRERSDSVMNAIYSFAENSKDNGVLILAYLFDAQRHLSLYDRKRDMEAVRTLAEKAYNLSSAGNYPDYTAYSYLYMAHSSRRLGDLDAAKESLARAYNLVSNSKSDSLKTEFYYLRSQVLQDKRELNLALDDALQVQQIAERSENINLRALAYWRLGDMYGDIDSVKAKVSYKELAEVSRRIGDNEQLISADLRLGRFFSRQKEFAGEGSRYLHEAMSLARRINHRNLIIQSHLVLTRFYLTTGQPDSTINYLESNIGDIINYYTKNGQAARIYYTYGTFYYDLGKYYKANKENEKSDNSFWQALKYFVKSDSAYASDAVTSRKSDLSFYQGASNYNLYFLNKNSVKTGWFMSAADSGKQREVSNYFTNATYYFFRTQEFARKMDDPEFMRNVFSWMEYLFQDSALYYDNIRKNNEYTSNVPRFDYYKMSFLSRQLYDSCDVAFQSLSNQKEKIRIEGQNEARLAEIAAIRKHQRDNIKQIGITVVLVLIFLLLILAGFLRVSEFTIRALGFFAFLFLFEFLILIIDKQLHDLTHGEVISLLAVKIVIAGILLPLHHFLEKKVIYSLTRRKLLRENSGRMKEIKTGMREDTYT